MNVVDMPSTEKDEPANVLQLEAGNGGQRSTKSTWRKRLSRSKKDGGIKSTLDPEGVLLPAGADLYFQLMRNLTAGFKSCLATAS